MSTIADTLNILNTHKEDIKSAIIEKGVLPNGGLSTYADAIRNINSNTTFVSGVDFSQIGYNAVLDSMCNDEILNEARMHLAYSKECQGTYDANGRPDVFNRNEKIVYGPSIRSWRLYSLYAGASNLKYVGPITVEAWGSGDELSCNSMFWFCKSLLHVEPFWTSQVTDMGGMFYYCESLTHVPEFDTSKVTNMGSMFFGCIKLTSIPNFDTSSVTNMRQAFTDCIELTSLPLLDTGNVTDATEMLYNCYNLSEVGGFKDLGKQPEILVTDFCQGNTKLTHESLMNIINGLYDRASAGYSIVNLPLGLVNIGRLTDEDIAIATNKGWNITAYSS